jgi:hypothetical protein
VDEDVIVLKLLQEVDVTTPVPSFGPRMVCTVCGIVGSDARANWRERPEQETMLG